MKIEIKNSMLCVGMEEIIGAMTLGQKRETLAWLATDREVVESVVSHLTGKDDLGWSSGDPNIRQRILIEIEDSQIASPRFQWRPWDEIRQSLKDIRSSQHIYWVLYHKLSDDIRAKVMNELRTMGVESNYTTEKADADIKRVESMISEAFTSMKKPQAATI